MQVLERQGRKDEALQVFEQAYAVDADSPMVGFRRAKAYASAGRIDVRPFAALHSISRSSSSLPVRSSDLQIALPALQQLAILAPDEFNIHFLLGKIHLALGDRPSATRAFASALDLEPGMGPAIKAAQTPRESAEDDQGVTEGSQMTEGAGA